MSVDGSLNDLVSQAQDDFDYCKKPVAMAMRHWEQDYKFAFGDAYNLDQWPDDVLRSRQGNDSSKPCLTVNKTAQHNLQITNSMKQNKIGVKYRAAGAGASYDSARVFDAIARHIEYQSNAQAHYDQQAEFMVNAGKGALRVTTRYADDRSFDQEIFVEGIANPLMVLFDPDAREPDKSDQKRCFVFVDVNRKDFENKRKYRKYRDVVNSQPLVGANGWLAEDKVRIAEYWRVEETNDTLYLRGDGSLIYASQLGALKAQLEQEVESGEAQKRAVERRKVMQYVIVGGSEIESERKEWVGSTIPIVPVIGRESRIDGEIDYISHTRALIDPQRIYNYFSSTAVEYGALQTKTPWLTPMATYEEFQRYYDTANVANHAVLPYNHIDENGEQIPPPQRIEPPVPAPVALAGMQTAANEMMMASGQYQATLGEQGNERSGKAINERQQQGENATFHFNNGLAIAVRRIGVIIMEIVPRVYDTKRVLLALADDGSPMEIMIDPRAQQAAQKQQAGDQQIAQWVFNPAIGNYYVMADTGPAYGTRKQETFNAISLILTQAPQLTQIIGDLLLRSADFQLADEAAARLRRMVPPEATGDGPTQSEQQLQQQVQQLQSLLTGAMQELGQANLRLRSRDQMRDIDAYNAITTRLKTLLTSLKDSGRELNPEDMTSAIMRTLREFDSGGAAEVIESNEPAQKQLYDQQEFVGVG